MVSQRFWYSFSGSITTISVPSIIERRTSSFAKNDLPLPAFAKTQKLAFSSEKRSNITKLLLLRLTPYKIPSSEVRSAEIKGKIEEVGPELSGVRMANLSVAKGKTEEKASSCWKRAGLI